MKAAMIREAIAESIKIIALGGATLAMAASDVEVYVKIAVGLLTSIALSLQIWKTIKEIRKVP